MKLPKLNKSQKQEKLTLYLPDTQVMRIDEYIKYYMSHYNQEITRPEIIKHILEVFIDTDKDFKQWNNKAATTLTQGKE